MSYSTHTADVHRHLRNEVTMRSSVYHNIPTSYEQAREMTQGRRRHIGYATRLYRAWNEAADICLHHHDTTIVTYHINGSVTVNTGGWHSSTTKARINAALRDSPWSIGSKRGEWFWYHHRYVEDSSVMECMFEFEDGDRVYLKGEGAKDFHRAAVYA